MKAGDMNFGTPRSSYRTPIKHSDDATFIRTVHDRYTQDAEADEHNRTPAREDIRFTIGDQWNEMIRAEREANNKPVLTVNRLPAFVAQFVGSWMQSDTAIKLTPTHGGNKAVAEVRQGLIRSIIRGPMGKHAVDQAMTHSYICGIGNFSLSTSVFSKG